MRNKHPPRSLFSIILYVIGLGLAACGAIIACQVPEEIQYIVSAPENRGEIEVVVQKAQKTLLDVSDRVESACISGKAQNMIASTNVSATAVTVYAVDTGYTDLFYRKMISGRLISKRDVEESKNVIMIDQKTAYMLFPAGEALDQTIWIGDAPWTVIGIMSNHSQLGEADDSTVYIPLSAAIKRETPIRTLEIRLQYRSRDSSATQIREMLTGWRKGGSFHNLPKEKISAAMPLLWIAVIVGFCLIRWLYSTLLKYTKRQYEMFQEKLCQHYAYQMTGWICWKLLIVMLMGIALCTVAYGVISLLRLTALMFPEWIPEKPVSIASYTSRFWDLHHVSSASVQYTSQGESTVALAAWLIQWGCFSLLAAEAANLLRERIMKNTLYSGGKRP